MITLDRFSYWGIDALLRVLIGDDHALFAEGMRRMLENESDISFLGVASNGEEAVSMAIKLSPDMVILDVVMPVLDGIEAARRIKSDCPNTMILMLSAYNYESYLLASIESGVDGYLSKNTAPRSLLNAIRLLSDGLGVFCSNDIRDLITRVRHKNSKSMERHILRDRELELLMMVATGMSNKMIANELSLSQNTVRSHFAKIFRKLNVNSRTEAVVAASKMGLISIE